MKKLTKHIAAMLLGILMLFSAMPLSAFAANNDTNYGKYSCPTRVLKYQSPQMHGNDVKWLQCAINYLVEKKAFTTSKLDVDGYFGQASKKAVEAFQTAYKNKYSLSVDGCFGPASRKAMVEILNSYSSSCTNHNWLVTKRVAATCTTSGMISYKCYYCGAITSDTIPATGHSFDVSYNGPFKTTTCKNKNCDYCVDERHDFLQALKKGNKFTASQAAKIANNYITYYNELKPNTNTNIKNTVTNVGKICGVTSNLLKNKNVKQKFQDAANTCDYLNLAIDVHTMVSNEQNDSTKMAATIDVLSGVTSKVDFGGYFSSALNTIKTASNDTINAVRLQYVKQALSDMVATVNEENDDLTITIGKTKKKISLLTMEEINNNRDAVNYSLTKHYNALNSVKGKAIKGSMTVNEYIDLFMDVKRRQPLYANGKKTFDYVANEIIKLF